MTDTFCYSTNEEYYNGDCASREEAVRECVAENELEVGAAVWTGKSVAFSPENHACASDIVDRLQEAAQEHAGEAADRWLYPLTIQQEEDLERRVGIAITEWLTANNLHPTFWGIANVEKHVVTAADLPAQTPATPAVSSPAEHQESKL